MLIEMYSYVLYFIYIVIISIVTFLINSSENYVIVYIKRFWFGLLILYTINMLIKFVSSSILDYILILGSL